MVTSSASLAGKVVRAVVDCNTQTCLWHDLYSLNPSFFLRDEGQCSLKPLVFAGMIEIIATTGKCEVQVKCLTETRICHKIISLVLSSGSFL